VRESSQREGGRGGDDSKGNERLDGIGATVLWNGVYTYFEGIITGSSSLGNVGYLGQGTGEPRKPTDVSVFVDNVVDVVDCGRGVYRGCELGLGLGRIRNWVRGERFSVGTGGWFFFFFSALKDLMDLSFFFIAQTSRFASYLPWAVLDLVIDIPHSLRNRLFKTQQPLREPPPPLSTPVTVPSVVISRSKTSTASEHDDGSSEADVESVSGDSGVSSGSWVDLNAGQPGRG